jgi:N-acyl-D-amino-acid deacylase
MPPPPRSFACCYRAAVTDLLLMDGTVVDGSGAAPFPGWVAVSDARIEAVGRATERAPVAAATRSLRGQVIAPGFVDVHNHSDLSPFVLPDMPSTIRQGVTTVVVGNCGSSPWPLAGWGEALDLAYARPGALPRPAWASWGDYLDAIDAASPRVNVATLVGHGTVRREVLGDDRRPPTPAELDQMAGLVRDAIADGAVGLSSGLIYVPGIHAHTDELVAVATAAADAGGLYASHIRGEGRDLFAAVGEAIEIGMRARVPVHISHLKCESTRVWGRAGELLGMLRDGRDVTGDQYPYAAWNSSLSSLLPPWAPVEELPQIVRAEPERLRDAVLLGEPGFQSSVDGVGWEHIVLVTAPEPRWRGRNMDAVAEDLGLDPFDAFVALLERDPDIACIGHAMDQADVDEILGDPAVFVASDASATSPVGPGGDLPVHPRDYGTFPRALAAARDRGLLSIEAMVRKMTSLPAARFGLHDRGALIAGYAADIVVFDAEGIRDTATFERPHSFPDGVGLVLVNGATAWSGGGEPHERAGRALRHT